MNDSGPKTGCLHDVSPLGLGKGSAGEGDALLDGCTDVPERMQMCQKGWARGSRNETDAGSPTALGSQEKLAVLRCDFRSLPQQIATAANIRESTFSCARSVC